MARKTVLHRIFNLVCDISPSIKSLVWSAWYQYISGLDKDANMTFMNYGYVDLNPNAKKIKLRDADKKNLYCIQLYHHVANAINLDGLNVLEVGCGRGGGSSYIMRYLKPRSMGGVDFSNKAIEFCKKHYPAKGLSFYAGDAELLPFEDNKFDVIINIESSHCYAHMKQFLREVFRLLRPNGYFLFADFRNNNEINSLRKQLKHSGLKLIKEENLTQNVLKSLDMGNERKMKLIKQKVPKILHKTFLQFAGIKGSEIYESFKTGERKYFNFVLQKNILKFK